MNSFKNAVLTIVLIMLGTAICYPQVQVPKAATAPIIDGTMEAVWNNAYIDSTKWLSMGEYPEPSDLSLEYRLLWDDNGFYLFVSVTDDILLTNNIDEAWLNDELGLYVDGGHEQTGEYDENDINFSWQYDKDAIHGAYNHGTTEDHTDDFPNSSFASQVTDHGVNYEIALNGAELNSVLSLSLTAGTEFGFMLYNSDNDTGERDVILSIGWYDYLAPASWVPFKFVNTIEHPVDIEIPKTVDAPVIDGQLDPVWQNTISKSIIRRPLYFAAPDNSADFSVDYRIMWDDENIYLYVRVMDDDISIENDTWYENDAISISIDVENVKNAYYSPNDRHFAYIFGAENLVGVEGPRGFPLEDYSNCQFRSREAENGYDYEIALSATDLATQCGFDLSEGVPFGLLIEVIDNDFGEGRDHIFINSTSSFLGYWYCPGVWKTYIPVDHIIYPGSISLTTTVDFPTRSKGSDYRPADYRIFGLPGASNILIGNLFTGAQDEDWQVYWDNGDPDVSAAFKEYNGDSDIFQCEAGRAFWILNKGSLTIDQGETGALALNNDGQVAIDLHPGWNLITNPYPVPVEWQKVRDANALAANAPLYGFNGGWDEYAVMEPFTGYYFQNTTDLDFLDIPFDPEGFTLPKPGSNNPFIWKVDISLKNEDILNKCCYIAVDRNATGQKDDNEFHLPRTPLAIPCIFFNRPEWDKSNPAFANDVRPLFAEIENWEFTVQTPSLTESILAFSGLQDIPDEFSVYLIDHTVLTAVDLRETGQYTFTPVKQTSAFTISVGTDESVQAKLDQILPGDYTLHQNFPNPFNPTTTIPFSLPERSVVTVKIFNIMGQEIRQLGTDSFEAGKHHITWNGTNEKDIRAASGIYIVQLTTSTGRQLTGKMILLK